MQTGWSECDQLNYNQAMPRPASPVSALPMAPFQYFAPLLLPAARAHCRPEHLQRLEKLWDGLPGWQGLAEFAEEQGLAPLFDRYARQAGLDLPPTLRLQLQGLSLRHRLANLQRSATLSKILAVCQEAGIEVVLLKGAALFQSVYPDPALRPMRDLDLLTRPEQSQKMVSLLKDLGFRPDSIAGRLPLHHLPSLTKPIEGMQLNVEVHFSLYHADWHVRTPKEYEWIDRSRPFDFLGQTAYSLCLEDLLWHIYQHAVNGPLRLISLADLVSVAEHFVDQIDWDMIRRAYPALLAALALIHPHAQLDDRLLQFAGIAEPIQAISLGTGVQGWPMKSLADGWAMGTGRFLQSTFQPGDWLLAFYYGIKNGQMIPIYRWVIHPLHIFKIAWIRLVLRFRAYQRYLPGLPQ
jgi:hypothetical protein